MLDPPGPFVRISHLSIESTRKWDQQRVKNRLAIVKKLSNGRYIHCQERARIASVLGWWLGFRPSKLKALISWDRTMPPMVYLIREYHPAFHPIGFSIWSPSAASIIPLWG